jgi:SDR family mycofactocin-dependent oxidoreductase
MAGQLAGGPRDGGGLPGSSGGPGPTGAAIVTGAARGIGAATVRRLAAAGWAVLALDICEDDPAIPYPLARQADLDDTVRRARALSADGSRIDGRVADVRDRAGLTEAVAWVEARWGGLDAAISVAGVIAGGVPLWEMPLERVAAMFETNLAAVATLAQVAVPALLRRPEPRYGRFVAVSSAAAAHGLHGLAAYGATKAGVEGLVRGLAADLRGTGITANAVRPGSTATPMLDESARLYRLDSPAAFASRQLIGRLLDPDEVAASVVWLVGPDGSGVTGTVLSADGGFTG